MTNEAKQYLDLIINEPVKIGHWIGFNDLIDMHNDWLKMMMFSKQDETLLAHRRKLQNNLFVNSYCKSNGCIS